MSEGCRVRSEEMTVFDGDNKVPLGYIKIKYLYLSIFSRELQLFELGRSRGRSSARPQR